MTRWADVWVLLGAHRGDNSQILALAEALQRPFRTIEMRYRRSAYLPAVCRSVSVSGLTFDARRQIVPPWPSLVLGAVISPRTSRPLAAAAQAVLGKRAVVTGPFPRYGALLQAADEIHVTGDGVSMLSDAIASGKLVGLIPLEPDLISRFVHFVGRMRGRPFRIRELGKFWDDLRTRGLVGTIDSRGQALLMLIRWKLPSQPCARPWKTDCLSLTFPSRSDCRRPSGSRSRPAPRRRRSASNRPVRCGSQNLPGTARRRGFRR